MIYTIIDKGVDGIEIIPAIELQWVKMQSNGIYILCDESEGHGIVLDGEIYHVAGRPQLDEHTVSLIVTGDIKLMADTKIAKTKTALEAYLAEHPLLWTDDKHYSVTVDKQALLNNAIAVYQLGVQAEIDPVLEWNATGEECIAWEFADLCALALGIAAYVKPLVAHQQALEVAIRAAETAEEVQAVEIDYAALA